MKTLVIGLGTLVLVALGRPALAQRCLSFRPPAFFAGAAVAPGYPYLAYGYPVYPYYPYPLPPAPSLGFGRGGIYGHVFVGRDESITSYTFPGRDSWQWACSRAAKTRPRRRGPSGPHPRIARGDGALPSRVR